VFPDSLCPQAKANWDIFFYVRRNKIITIEEFKKPKGLRYCYLLKKLVFCGGGGGGWLG
jgi:hypothetical protein